MIKRFIKQFFEAIGCSFAYLVYRFGLALIPALIVTWVLIYLDAKGIIKWW